jgi:ribosomal-protein-alanine N-acetyltransferase
MIFNAQIETSRLLLRGWNQQSFHDLFADYSQPQIMEMLGISSQNEYEIELSRYNGGYSTYNLTIQFFQLVAKESQQILGWCGFHSWAQQHQRAEVFYALKHEENRRQGLMSEALKAVLEFGLNEMNLRRIEAFVATNNPASYRLLEKFHFKKEATVKHRYQFGDDTDWDFMYAFIKYEKTKIL